MKKLNTVEVKEVNGGVVEGGCILLPPGFPIILK
jgi:arginine/lysine/ornithine decarboxylase